MRTRILASSLLVVMAAALPTSAQTAASPAQAARPAQEAAQARLAAEARLAVSQDLIASEVAAAMKAAAWAEVDQAAVSDAARDAVKQAARAAREAAATASVSHEDALYKSGTAALDAGQWTKALAIYTQLAEMRGTHVDASLYWKAYALYKLAQREAALGTIQELQKSFSASRWLNEANALAVEIRSAAGDIATAESGDDELKLLALNGLMAGGNVEQSVAILDKMLKSQQSQKLKKRALFVLSQNQSPKAHEIVLSIAKGASNPDLQMDAIQYLGMFGGQENQQTLAAIYAASSDVSTKRRILQAYMVGGQKDRLLQAAKAEPNTSLRAEAIRMLGAQSAGPELWQLYQTETAPELKRALVDAFMMNGNVDRLLEIARTDKDVEIKLKAVRTLGILGSTRTGPALIEMYGAQGQTPEIKRAVAEGLFLQGNAKALVDMARKETDPALRKSLVEKLSVMKSKEATDFLLELLNK